jgi:hypothetical protein
LQFSSNKGAISNSIESIDNAVYVFNEVRQSLEKETHYPQLLGHVCNSLGAALLRKAKAGNENQSEIYEQAKSAYQSAILASEFSEDPEVWGVSNLNLAEILAREANALPTNDKAGFLLRLRSISCYLAAIETYPAVLFPYPYAQAHSGLAEVLLPIFPERLAWLGFPRLRKAGVT